MLIDTHAHFKNLSQAKSQVSAAKEKGVGYIIVVGADINSSKTAVEIANSIPNVKAAVGVHPHDAAKHKDNLAIIKELATEKNVVAVGECGLDYHYMHSPEEDQKEVFINQIRIAKDVNKPVIIHSREAMDETLKLMKTEGMPKAGGVLHCFSGNVKEAETAISLDCYLAFGGVITFKNAMAAKVASILPAERLLLETDSPYLSPEPFRGKQNSPANLLLIAHKMAEIKNLEYEKLSRITTENAIWVFDL